MINVLMYAMMIFLIIRIILLSKIDKKNKRMIDGVQSIDDRDVFFEKMAVLKEEMKDDAIYTEKIKIITLWGMAYHREYDGFLDLLETIDVTKLIRVNKDKMTVAGHEDSFFYLFLSIPNILFRDGKDDLREAVRNKMNTLREILPDELCRNLSDACEKFYQNEDDRGRAFFEKVLEGDYGEFHYSKNMIGVYKSICAVTVGKIYQENGETEKFDEIKDFIISFSKNRLGKRWIEAVKVEVPEEVEEPAAEKEKAEEPESTEESE